MRGAIISFIITMLCIVMSGCRSMQQYVPIEISKVDSISKKSEILTQRVQNLMNEIRVWESRRDSISARDSVSVRDSIVLYLNELGEVVSKERFRDKFQKSNHLSFSENSKFTEITRQYIDSILTAQKNELMATIEESQQVPIPVERELSKWEHVKQEIGGISIGILVVIVVIAVIWLIRIKNHKQ